MTPGLLCMPSSGLHSLPPTLSQTHKCFWALSIVHCCCGLLRHILLPGRYIYIKRNISSFLVYILFRAAPVCLCVCSSHSHSPTPTSFPQCCCLCYISVFLSSHVLFAWQPARTCYCDSSSSPSWLRLVPWCQQPRAELVLGVLTQPSCSTRYHQPLLSPRAPSPQSPRGVSISPGYSSP